MPNDVDKSLLDRLQALRGSSSTPERPAPPTVEVDVIERKRTPTRDDKLRERLKSLREGSVSSPKSQKEVDKGRERSLGDETAFGKDDDLSEKLKRLRETRGGGTPPVAAAPGEADERKRQKEEADDEIDAAFQTSDKDLEELLRDVPAEESFATTHQEPDDAQVRALLEQLSDAIPRDKQPDKQSESEAKEDNSDGEDMQREVDDVIARFRDEIEMEKDMDKKSSRSSPKPPEDQDEDEGPPPDLALPDVPVDPQASSTNVPSSMDGITARLLALRAPSEEVALPSVPINKPAKGPKRLESRTNYTDDDVDSWCTVCLADATLLCLGCEEKGEPYCVRCWREMHVGPAAAFDDRSHKAVQFGKKNRKEKKVALGA